MGVNLCATIQSPEKEAIGEEKQLVRMTSRFRFSSGPGLTSAVVAFLIQDDIVQYNHFFTSHRIININFHGI